jgi:hypothetical protein
MRAGVARCRQIAQERRRIGIVQRLDRGDLAVARAHAERAPVRAVREAARIAVGESLALSAP